jgi:predicted aldo/keto reductase-like oxidoreductase
MRLGKTDMMVSRVGFGGIPIQRLTEDEAVNVVRECLDLGVTFLDTARVYTTSEERIGKAITGRREGLILSTRTPSRTKDQVASNLNESLQRLGTDYIDLFHFHGVNDYDDLKTVLDPDGPITILHEAKCSGVVKHIGFTTHDVEVAKEGVKSGQFETVMIALNFVNDTAANELVPMAKELDVGVIAMKPLAGGMLDNVKLAFKYLLGFSGVLPLVGIDRTEYMKEVVNIVEAPWFMSNVEQQEMAKVKAELGSRFCRHCDYCQPCPQGVSISSVLYARSMIKRYPLDSVFSGTYVGRRVAEVEECIECGDCEDKCPYHLPIREMLKEEASYYWAEKKKYEEQMV